MTVAGSGRSGRIFGPSLIKLAIAVSRASTLSASRRSTSWSTRSLRAASAAACARAAGAGHQEQDKQSKNATAKTV